MRLKNHWKINVLFFQCDTSLKVNLRVMNPNLRLNSSSLHFSLFLAEIMAEK